MITKTRWGWNLAAITLLGASVSPTATRAQDTASAVAGFETVAPRTAAELLAKEVLAGPHHTVRPGTVPYLFDYNFTIDSDFGVFYAYGADGVARRVNEIYAIAELEKLKTTKTFVDAAAKAALSPLNTAKDLVTKPLKTVDGVAKGAVDTGKSVVGGVRGGIKSLVGREKSTKTEYEDGAIGELSGYSRIKRALAVKLNVDPYSSNAVLQKELQGVARIAALGDVGVGAGLAVLTSGITRTAISATSASSDFRAALLDKSPIELKAEAKGKMREFGCSKEVIEQFVGHVPLLPTQRAFIVYTATKFEGVAGRETVFVAACKVRDEIEAIRFIKGLLMLEKQHAAGVEIERFVECGRMVAVVTADGKMKVPLPGSQISWISEAQRIAGEIAASKPAGRAITGRELLVVGNVTPTARGAFEASGIALREAE